MGLISKTIDVDTGEIHVASEPAILQSIALGSCVAFIAYEPDLKIGGLAHIMLPGTAPNSNKSTKYAEDAIRDLLVSICKLGVVSNKLEISIIGGGNVLQEGDLPDKVVESVLHCLKSEHLKLKGMRVGGIIRRSAYLDISSGRVFYTEGDNISKIELTKIERID